MIAAFNGSEKVAILLVNHGADINATDRDGYAPIHWAAYNGYQNVISLLLRKAAGKCNEQRRHDPVAASLGDGACSRGSGFA